MKKHFFSIVCLLLVSTLMFAQDAEKSYKKAKNAYFSFNNAADPMSSGPKLFEAASAIEEAITYPENKDNPAVFVTRGNIYLMQLQHETTAKLAKKEFKADPKAAILAYQSFVAATKVPVPVKGSTKEALEGVANIQGYLNFLGGTAADAKDYPLSFEAFNSLLSSHDFLKAQKKASALDDAKMYGEVAGYVLSLASQTGKLAEIEPLMMTMVAGKANNLDLPGVYNSLYGLYQDKDEAKAVKFLEEGRQRHPDDQSLLYSEINYYLKNNKLDNLIDRLKLAISKDPKNPSLYLTLGNVYDQLATKFNGEGNTAKGAEYQNDALSYYDQAITIDPKNFDSNYSVGVVYYNRAAERSKELNALANDFSAEGEKKYATKEKEMLDAFAKALPYFQAAEKANPNELSVLGALKEIYTRQGNMEASADFKKRMEVVQGGGKNTPYHK